jgi:hypothetical protein
MAPSPHELAVHDFALLCGVFDAPIGLCRSGKLGGVLHVKGDRWYKSDLDSDPRHRRSSAR